MNLLTIAASLLLTSSQTATSQPAQKDGLSTTRVRYQFRMLHEGKQIGTANYERITTSTERHRLLTVDVSENGFTITATFDELFKRDGSPEKKSYHGVQSFQSNVETFTYAAEFKPSGVDYSVNKGAEIGKPKTLTPPRDAVLADPSEIWFDGVNPKIGDTATYTNLDVQTAAWETTTETYVDDENMVIGKKTYKTHHMHVKTESGQIEMFLDDGSDIVVMDQVGGVRLERAE